MKAVILEAIAMVLLVAAIIFVVGQIPGTVSTKSSPTNISVLTPSASGSPSTSSPNGNSSNSNSTSPSSGGNTTTTAQSSEMTENWAGYASTSGNYTYISGSWNIPQVSSSDITASDATWVGIGGISSQDLIQVGTQNIVSANGQVQTSAFYETLPEASQDISSITVNPGDSVSASVSETSTGQWTIDFVDNTNGQSYSTTVSYDSSQSSAEWIEEDPYDGVSFVPLDNFGSVTFSSATTINNGSQVNLSDANAEPVEMVNGSDQVEASVSTVGSNGSSFTVTRSDVPSGEGISQFNDNPWSFIRRGSGIGFSFGSF